MSQLPDPQSLTELGDTFERLQRRRLDPEEDAHRRGLEQVVVRLASLSVLALLAVCSWVVMDPQGRYGAEQRQQGLLGLFVGRLVAMLSSGAKISISVTGEGFTFLDRLSYDLYNEGEDLKAQAIAYRRRHGH